ncbi:putative fasciclin-like arabinogalactan protein 20 [Euphorbia lathyris]|uniref:putative fasciclin-like arabinogalactan protein 20 n=1 Tax=Euphorbia lathyris TaxID=212925 RepID=UPI00331440BE
MAAKLLLSLTFLFLFSFSSSVPMETLLEATDILSNSGYLSMALTLQLVSDSIIPHSPSLTVFSPSDSAFSHSGQPSRALLQFHLSPLTFRLNSLQSLPQGSQIPTFFTNHSLTITSSGNSTVSVNGVNITDAPYDDGSLVIIGIDNFLDPGFEPAGAGQPEGTYVTGNLGCSFDSAGSRTGSAFSDAARVLRSKGCSVMASFLDLQLLGFKDQPMLTIFAPIDEVMNGYVGNVEEYASIFLRHVVPCKIMWKDLLNYDDGMVFDTYLEGFGITMSRSGDILMLNEVPVSFPDMYQNDWLVVHGIRGVLGVDGQQETSDGEF